MFAKQLGAPVFLLFVLVNFGYAAEAPKNAVPAAVQTNELDKPYAPTRKDWLELSVPLFLQAEVSAWSQKPDYSVVINDAAHTIEVSLRCSKPTVGCRFYMQESSEALKAHLEGYLRRYDWAKNLKVAVSVE